MKYKRLFIEKNESSITVTLNRPDALNAVDIDMMKELVSLFAILRSDNKSRVIILKGAGKAFCAGLDLNSIEEVNVSVRRMADFQRDIGEIIRLMRQCPQPIISVLNGAVCGFGFSMALASDIRLATPDCRMNAAYIRVGLGGCDMGSSYLLPRLVGTSIASELLLTGRFIEAERALDCNLISAIAESDKIYRLAEDYVNDMLLASPMGLRLTKEVLGMAVDAPSLDSAMALEDRQQVLLLQCSDFEEAKAAFMEKRSPSYRGE